MTAGWLLDTSAAARAARPEVASAIVALLRGGLLWTCPLLDTEALSLAGSAAEHRRLLAERHEVYRHAATTPAAHERALALQARLLDAAPAVPVPAGTLLVAATAQEHGLAVLHCDPALELLGRRCGVAERSLAGAAVLP